MGEILGHRGTSGIDLRAFGIESEDLDDWLRPDWDDQVVVIRSVCDRCLAAGYDEPPIWYN